MGYENNKPPDRFKFKKGQSGNLQGGRLHKGYIDRHTDYEKLVATELDRMSQEQITIVEKGKRRKASTSEVRMRRQMDRMMKGDLRAGRLVIDMARKFFSKEVQNEGPLVVISETEAKRRGIKR